MADAPIVRVALDLEPDADPIRGTLQQEGEPPRSFWGWLELASLLERVRTSGVSESLLVGRGKANGKRDNSAREARRATSGSLAPIPSRTP